MDQMTKAASQEELDAFVAGAMEKFAEHQVPDDVAKALLQNAIEKYAADMGFVRTEPVRPEKVEGFKKTAKEALKNLK